MLKDATAINPKYNGPHACPKCGAISHWTCVDEYRLTIRIECEAECGVFEEPYPEIERLPFFGKCVKQTGKSKTAGSC